MTKLLCITHWHLKVLRPLYMLSLFVRQTTIVYIFIYWTLGGATEFTPVPVRSFISFVFCNYPPLVQMHLDDPLIRLKLATGFDNDPGTI